MLENWCWMRDELKRMSCHYTKLDGADSGDINENGEIPDTMLDNLIKSRNVNRALWYLRQL
jgi:metallopeptidase MepB